MDERSVVDAVGGCSEASGASRAVDDRGGDSASGGAEPHPGTAATAAGANPHRHAETAADRLEVAPMCSQLLLASPFGATVRKPHL